MVDDLWPTGRRLWKTSPAWSYSVISAMLFTLMSLPHLLPDRSPPPQDPPPKMPDKTLPAGNLAAYLKFYYGLYSNSSFSYGAQSCETIIPLFRLVNRDDPLIGKLGDRKPAIDNGNRCDAAIEASDRRFQALSLAITAAGSVPTRALLDEVMAAQKALTSFDLARPSETPTLQRAQAFIQASDSRIADFMRSVEEFQRDPAPSAAAYQHAQDALQKIDADRDRMTSADQKQALVIATDASAKLRDVHARLAQLPDLIDSVQRDPSADQQLTAALEALNPDLALARAVATPDQAVALDKAREMVKKSAWSRLDHCLQDVDKDPNNPARYPPLVSAYQLVKSLSPPVISTEQQQMLSRAKLAADKLSMSDQRLKAVIDAAGKWQRREPSSGDAVLAALHDIEQNQAFDRPRFQKALNQDWSLLIEARKLLEAREKGLNAETKSVLPICIVPAKPAMQPLSESVRAGLKRDGFSVIDDCGVAALITSIAKTGEETRSNTNSGGMIASTTTVHIDLSTKWADDNQIVASASGTINVTGIDPDSADSAQDALRRESQAIIQKFRSATGGL